MSTPATPPDAGALLSCPFCGGDARYEHVHAKATDGMRWSIGCDDEECHGYMSFTTHERKCDAAAAWNRRASPVVTTAAGDGCARIRAERARQVNVEGWTAEHDAQHSADELATAAAVYAAPGFERSNRPRVRGKIMEFWPWHASWFKPCRDDRVRELVKAGALCAAAIDRELAALAAESGSARKGERM